jgi:Tfp pilus assembly protein PilN
MVTSDEPLPQEKPPRFSLRARGRPGPSPGGPRTWLLPGPAAWEIWEKSPEGVPRLVRGLAGEGASAPRVDVTGLPARLVTCQLVWLETTEEKAVPDLLRMQCERRALLRQHEVWTHRVLRVEGGRSLAQVMILQNAAPPELDRQVDARFEAFARCLSLPPRSVCLWLSLGSVEVALTNDDDVVYFQALPHQGLTRECLGDVRTLLWQASAQGWIPACESLVLVGEWNFAIPAEWEQTLGLKVGRMDRDRLNPPAVPMELTPKGVRHLRLARRRQRRLMGAGLVLAAIYVVFLILQIFTGVATAVGNSGLQSRLDAIMPRVLQMQETARAFDALNPALDAKTFPLEILYRATVLLPERGVRLTRFEITGDRLEIGGESTTAREAFDYMRNLEEAEALNHIEWETAPQPIPLPNDTTRFSIQGTITGAYHDADET